MDTHSIQLKEKGYPSLLKEIFDPPKTLFYKGRLPKSNVPTLAVVGARKMTPYGKSVLLKIIPSLARAGIAIISGLAHGVDGEAHRITLENQGITHAVIGSGLDETLLYPQSHIPLARDIVKKNGSIITEHALQVPAIPRHFAMRNRIIAGLAHAVLIVEAAEKSGSLITAECALASGREVMAVPGDITKYMATGTNNLIKNGAHIVTTPEDILSLFSIDLKKENKTIESENSDSLLSFLTKEPLHINDIAQALDLTVSDVSARLSRLEISGGVEHVGGMYYIKK